MNYFKIYDDMPCLWAKHHLPEKLHDALGKDWIVEFYTLDLDWDEMGLAYSSVENPNEEDTFDIENDKVFILWNLIWSGHQDLNEKQQLHYLDLKKHGAKFKIQTYSACANLREMTEGNTEFRKLFGKNIVFPKCQPIMHDDRVVDGVVSQMADYFKKKKDDFA